EELGHTLVELVVPDPRDVEVHRVERLDGRLVVEETREGGRAADQVAGSNGQGVLVADTEVGELGGQVLAATGGRSARDQWARSARLQVAVVVVERQQLELDQLTLGVGVARRLRVAIATGR